MEQVDTVFDPINHDRPYTLSREVIRLMMKHNIRSIDQSNINEFRDVILPKEIGDSSSVAFKITHTILIQGKIHDPDTWVIEKLPVGWSFDRPYQTDIFPLLLNKLLASNE